MYSSTAVYRTAGAAASRKAPTAVPTVSRRVTRFGDAPLVVDCPGVITRPFSSVAAAVGTGVASGVAATVGAGVGTACGCSYSDTTNLKHSSVHNSATAAALGAACTTASVLQCEWYGIKVRLVWGVTSSAAAKAVDCALVKQCTGPKLTVWPRKPGVCAVRTRSKGQCATQLLQLSEVRARTQKSSNLKIKGQVVEIVRYLVIAQIIN
eukprot:3194-Heterococcus_DN1.PRE.3